MKKFAVVVMLVVLLAGCAKQPPRLDLGVDVYVHPQASTPEDLILQAAIRMKMATALPRDSGAVYVRVLDGIVFLTGSVKSEEVKNLARDVAEKIDVRLEGAPIKPQGVRFDGLNVGG